MNAGTGLLEGAITYASRSVLDVTPALLPRPTPCRGWNLDMLLRHASESLAALHEGTVARHIALISAAPDRAAAADPARTFQDRAGRLLAAQATADGRCRRAPDIGGFPLPAFVMECAGGRSRQRRTPARATGSSPTSAGPGSQCSHPSGR
jgi:hypothetical protein